MEDSITAALSRNQNVWAKFLKPLKTLNWGSGGEDIIDGIIEVASTFKSTYDSISIFICGILPSD